MDEEKYIIDIKHIGKKFGNLTVLKDISSKIKKNEVVVIIGLPVREKALLIDA